MRSDKRPTNLKIGGMDWELLENDEVLVENSTYGESHQQYQRIYVSTRHKVQRQRLTALHEVLHAVADGVLLDGATLTEAQIVAVAPGLLQVLRDNPDFVAWLTAVER